MKVASMIRSYRRRRRIPLSRMNLRGWSTAGRYSYSQTRVLPTQFPNSREI